MASKQNKDDLTQDCGGCAGRAARRRHQVHDEEGRPAHDEGREHDPQHPGGLLLRLGRVRDPREAFLSRRQTEDGVKCSGK